MWGAFQHTNRSTVGLPEQEEKTNEAEKKLFKKIIAGKCQISWKWNAMYRKEQRIHKLQITKDLYPEYIEKIYNST